MMWCFFRFRPRRFRRGFQPTIGVLPTVGTALLAPTATDLVLQLSVLAALRFLGHDFSLDFVLSLGLLLAPALLADAATDGVLQLPVLALALGPLRPAPAPRLVPVTVQCHLTSP